MIAFLLVLSVFARKGHKLKQAATSTSSATFTKVPGNGYCQDANGGEGTSRILKIIPTRSDCAIPRDQCANDAACVAYACPGNKVRGGYYSVIYTSTKCTTACGKNAWLNDRSLIVKGGGGGGWEGADCQVKQDAPVAPTKPTTMVVAHDTVIGGVGVVRGLINAVAASHTGIDGDVAKVDTHMATFTALQAKAKTDLTKLRDSLVVLQSNLSDKKKALQKEDQEIKGALDDLRNKWQKLNKQQEDKISAAETKRKNQIDRVEAMLNHIDTTRRRTVMRRRLQ